MEYTIIETGAELSAIDLSEEIANLTAQGEKIETATAEIDGKAERAQILFIPDAGRAGIAWGADADWTDADSIEDAMERYCGIDGKAMVN